MTSPSDHPDTVFWRGVAGLEPIPPAAATLGWQFRSFDAESGTIEVSFQAGESFANPFGEVLGGFLAAMVFDVVGPAVLAVLDPGEFQRTTRLEVDFLAPAAVGTLYGSGRIESRNGDDVTLTATLSDANGTLLATATADATVIRQSL